MCNFSDELKVIEDSFHIKTHHFRCMGHVLNLGARAAFKVLADDISYLRAIIKKIRSSVSKSHEIFGNGLKVLLDCCTRWNSTYLMLERALMLKKVISVALNMTGNQ